MRSNTVGFWIAPFTFFVVAAKAWPAGEETSLGVAAGSEGQLAVYWNGAGVLETSSELNNDWTLISNAVASDLFSLESVPAFYRLRMPVFPMVDTNQATAFDDQTSLTAIPARGEAFSGQDASYTGAQPEFTFNGDGTVTDEITGLTWQQTPGAKQTWETAMDGAATFSLAGYGDWRLPTIKELYSLMDFRGVDPSGYEGSDTSGLIPFIDTRYFDFEYGNPDEGERVIDAQFWSATEYVSTTMNGDATVFGVNFADGRIKGYPKVPPSGLESTAFVRYVRENSAYGSNDFLDNGDGTITDLATGLMWLQADSGAFDAGPRGDGTLNWEEALAWAEGLDYAGFDDWRLPNAKELQALLDYSRSPDTTGSAAIDPVFSSTAIIDESGTSNFAWYWTGTTHVGLFGSVGAEAAYICFGEALGWMGETGAKVLLDVHGAGSQRSDPKSGDPADYPTGRGPQGDVIRIFNLVRPVRGGLISEPLQAPGAPVVQVTYDSYTLNLGDSIVLSASATGEPPLRYQWLKDGVAVSGASGGQVIIESFTESDAGLWSVQVSNGFGQDTVDVATLRPFSDQNILLLILDDWGTDASPFDNPGGSVASMPTLSALARDGLRFTRAYAQPLCSPTRASILTGRQPFQHRVGNPSTDSTLPDEEETLPEILTNLKAPHALASFGKWHLGSGATGPAETGGWPKFAGILTGGVSDYARWDKLEDGSTTADFTTYTTTDQVNEALEWLGEQGSRPWFLWMAFNAPHSPFHDPSLIDPALEPPSGYSVSDSDTRNSAHYIRMLETLDYEIERLLTGVDLETTTIIVVGDNGTPGQVVQAPYGDGHAKGTLYQGGIHVPMIVRGPAVEVPAGSTTDAIAHVTDLFGTVLELVGLDPVTTPGNSVDSTSLVPVFKGVDTAERRLVAEQFSDDESTSGRAIISGAYPDFKLIIFGHPNSSVDTPELEFYYIPSDPNEQSPLDIEALSSAAQAAFDACMAIDSSLGGGYSDPASGVLETVHVDLPETVPPLINANNGNIVTVVSITIGGVDAEWDGGTITVDNVTTAAARVDEDGNPDRYSVVATFDTVASGLAPGSYEIIVSFSPAVNPRAFTATNEFVVP